MQDMKKRHRQNKCKGEDCGASKLKTKQVIEIKEKLKIYSRGDYSKLAREYGIHINQILRIHNGECWKHV